VINASVKQEMQKILSEIQSGEFTRELIEDDDNGRPLMTKYRQQGAEHPIEVTGKKLRDMMSWVDRPISETA
jgi:ketol-acid reductoisomerase